MTKTKRQLRAEAVERLKNDAGARFSPDAIVCALLDGRRGKIDWSLECDAILDLLTDDDGVARSNDGATNLEWLYENDRDALLDIYDCSDIECDTCAFDKYDVCGNFDKGGMCRDWLISPHEDANDVFSSESVVTPEAVDANDGNATQDSREKLEADVLEIARKINMTEDGIQACSKELNALLDRQAAITESECLVKSVQGADAIAQAEIAELQDQLESAHAKNRALKAHISKMQEGRHGWHIKGKELQEKVDALTQANADYREEWHRVCRERDDLQRKLHESNREREQLRKQLGIAIDHAHDMIALVSLDGDAE